MAAGVRDSVKTLALGSAATGTSLLGALASNPVGWAILALSVAFGVYTAFFMSADEDKKKRDRELLEEQKLQTKALQKSAEKSSQGKKVAKLLYLQLTAMEAQRTASVEANNAVVEALQEANVQRGNATKNNNNITFNNPQRILSTA